MRKPFARVAQSMLLALAFGSGGMVAAETARPPLPADPIRHVPPVRLDQPQWRPLTGQQIRSSFSGRTLLVDEAYEVAPGVKVTVRYIGGCGPQEIFFADGRWRKDECQRGPRTYLGHWTIEAFGGGERLCVEALDPRSPVPRQCRFVWQGRSADQVIMPLATAAVSTTFSDYYNPYRLVKNGAK